jgi:transcriptional regulator with XRE-family HTH domain
MASDPLDDPTAKARGQLGRRFREMREEEGLALQEVADRTGISKSFLSLVEIGRSDLSVNRFLRLCEFYGVKPSGLLRESAGTASAAPTPNFVSPAEGSEIVMLRPPDSGSDMLPTLTIYAPLARTELRQHAGEEFVFVVEGRLRVVLEGEEILLEERDSHYFSGERPHRFENPDAERRAVKLSVQSEDRW